MPYFPKFSEQTPYRCKGCGGWFYHGNMTCLVAHTPGTCCHLHETPAPEPIRNPRMILHPNPDAG